jgi:hypothetical protein
MSKAAIDPDEIRIAVSRIVFAGIFATDFDFSVVGRP